MFCVLCAVCTVLRAHSATGSSCITAAGKGSSHPDRLLLISCLCCLSSVSKPSGKCQQVGAETKDACVFVLRTDCLRGGRGPDSGSCCFRTNPGTADVEAWSMYSPPMGPLMWLLSASLTSFLCFTSHSGFSSHKLGKGSSSSSRSALIPQVKVKYPRMTDLSKRWFSVHMGRCFRLVHGGQPRADLRSWCTLICEDALTFTSNAPASNYLEQEDAGDPNGGACGWQAAGSRLLHSSATRAAA